VNAQTVTLNTDERLYIIPCDGGGFSCHGFDVVANLTRKLKDWLCRDANNVPVFPVPPTDEVGTLEAYENYQALCRIAEAYCQQKHVRCDIELTPQLIGLEGKRVEVVDAYGDTRRFIVGKSTGWMPIHLEIARRNSSGGGGVTGAPFKSVRVVGRGKT
jgi:hypothetical protein